MAIAIPSKGKTGIRKHVGGGTYGTDMYQAAGVTIAVAVFHMYLPGSGDGSTVNRS